jgi:RHS repeat-associated protein
MHFRGTVNEPATVTVGGNPASVNAAGNFDGNVNVNVGTNTVAVTATDASGNARTNNYQVNVPSGVSANLLYDLNGNLTNDGTKTYEWDAANRCIAINFWTHRTEMSYDVQNRESKRVEKENATITGTKQFIWDSWRRAEERDGSNQVTKRFYAQGEQIGGSVYFYSRDHLASIRELNESTGAVRARYDYDPYGTRTKLSGDLDADFGFTGHYVSGQYSDLAFAPLRIYSANLGRWLSRDPIGENSGINLYRYVNSSPVGLLDPLGLMSAEPHPPPSPTPGPPTPSPNLPSPTPQSAPTPGPGSYGRQWDFYYHGNWGGPGWVSGAWRPESEPIPNPGDPDYRGPIDPEDACYEQHDRCVHDCPQCPNSGNGCVRACDHQLARCLRGVPHLTPRIRASAWSFDNWIPWLVH